MKEPSVHITKTQFIQLLDNLEIKAFPVDAFFRQAAKRAINTRAILVKNKRVNKKVTKVLLASKGDTQLTAELLYATRIKLHHRGVRKITELHPREWSLCKELTGICNQFAQEFKFDNAREAFITYISIGFERMGKNCTNWLTRLVSMSDNIFTYYASLQDSKNDDNPRETRRLYNIYNQILAETTGIVETEPIEKFPDKYLHFLETRKLLDEKHWGYGEYIRAQFEAMAWINGIPEPHNLYTQKAIDRYQRYRYKHNNPTSDEPEVEGSIWDMMNNNG